MDVVHTVMLNPEHTGRKEVVFRERVIHKKADKCYAKFRGDLYEVISIPDLDGKSDSGIYESVARVMVEKR